MERDEVRVFYHGARTTLLLEDGPAAILPVCQTGQIRFLRA
jgi:hypothetical protein